MNPWIVTTWDDQAVERQVDEVIAAGKAPVKFHRYGLKPYKGSSSEQRDIGQWKINIAIGLGLIPKPTVCSVCGKSGTLQYHAEDYSRPLLIAPMCPSCHLSLHAHFRSSKGSGSWSRKVAKYGNGTKWFEHL